MKIFVWVFLLLVTINQTVRAEEPRVISGRSVRALPQSRVKESAKNAIRLEALGRSFLYGIGYERLISDEVAVGVSFSRVMLGMTPFVAETSLEITSVPLYTNYYFTTGTQRLFATGGINILAFEVKAAVSDSARAAAVAAADEEGQTTMFDVEFRGSGVFAIPQAGVGYEYRARNGFLAGANLYGMYVGKFIPWVGMNIGINF